MKYLWLIWLPLLFLPDLGFQHKTLFGTLSISDFLIGPYLLMVYPVSRNKGKLFVNHLTPLMIAFGGWATISTLLIGFRYGYTTDDHIYFGLLKLGKLSLYGFAGVLTIKALSDDYARKWFHWSISAAGILVGINLISYLHQNEAMGTVGLFFKQIYLDNAISVILAILICYIGGLLINRYGSNRWRTIGGIVLLIMVIGSFSTSGRGGWVATAFGVTFLAIKMKAVKTLILAFVVSGLIFVAYNYIPTFKLEVDKTVHPDVIYLERYHSGIGGYDDGGRLNIWLREGKKFLNTPFLGTGYFHRGAMSGLWLSGSHNFFLQMFLETGLVGGGIVVVILLRMWQHAGSEVARKMKIEIPLKSSLIAAFVSGLSGEYFYGGMVLFVLLLVYGLVGSSEITNIEDEPYIFGVRELIERIGKKSTISTKSYRGF